MEIEAKYRVEDGQVFVDLLAARSMPPYLLTAEATPEIQQNIYFDTADGRIRRSQHALRVRTIGDKRIASWKGPTRTVGSVQERGEWEVEIHGGDAPEEWPASEARRRALEVTEGASLVPLIRVDTLRRIIRVDLAGSPLADLCLDEGTISAGGRSVTFRELEVEALTDRRSDFDALVLSLSRDTRLVPEPHSKFARGLQLLDQIPK